MMAIKVPCFAQAAITSEPTDQADEVFFANGDHLTGHLLDVTGESAPFILWGAGRWRAHEVVLLASAE